MILAGTRSSAVATVVGLTNPVNTTGRKSILRYLWRAILLRCSVCGKSHIFLPLLQTHSLRDWFTPLDGCPRCGYPYDREPGYFLASTWVINYGAGSVLGIAIYVTLEYFFHLDIAVLLVAVVTPVILFNILFARHSKALFIAIDHYFDPHEKDPGDDAGGNRPNPVLPTRDSDGPAQPLGTPTKSPRKRLGKSPKPTVLH